MKKSFFGGRWLAALILIVVASNVMTYYIAVSHREEGNPAGSYQPLGNKVGREKAWHEDSQIGSKNRRDPSSKESTPRDKFFAPEKASAPPPFATVDGSGRLTSAAAEAIGLSSQERVKVQGVFDEIWKELGGELRNHAVEDKSKSSEKDGRVAYIIPALPDRGSALLSKLHDNLEKEVGLDRARVLANSLNPNRMFGGFGQYDTELEMTRLENSDAVRVHFVYKSPTEGLNLASGDYSLDSFKSTYGNLFEMPDE
jgi:hypothetical protein